MTRKQPTPCPPGAFKPAPPSAPPAVPPPAPPTCADRLARAQYVERLRSHGVAAWAAEDEATRRFGAPTPEPSVDDRLEKAIEHDGDVMMQKAGFEVIKFSHPGKTKQTPGIADRRYYRRPRVIERAGGQYLQPALSVWWEAKSATGAQRPGQKVFQELVEACGEAYVLGGLDALSAWLSGVAPS